MGNCQAIDAATLVIQYPSGKVERFYSAVSARHVMKTNPGHYVALLISTTCPTKNIQTNNNNKDHTNTNPVWLTRIKLLKPTDNLLLGHVYRLITTQEVMKGLREKKQAKMMRQNMSESAQKPDMVVKEERKVKSALKIQETATSFDTQDNLLAMKPERQRPRTRSNNGGSVTAKTRFWQPSLQSISELAS